MKVLICIPTYNEVDNVMPLQQEIFQACPENVEILFIDDGSPDGTAIRIREIQAKNPKVHLIERSGKLGLGTAYVAGFRWGLDRGFDWIMEMDADFSHQALHLPEFLKQFQSGVVDAVVGSRYMVGGGVENWSRSRELLSRMGSLYSTIWLRHSVQDWTGGFNAWSAPVLRRIHFETLKSKGYAFQIELKFRTLQAGFRLVEIPIVFKERRAGQSKMSGSIVKEAIFGVISLAKNDRLGTLYR